VVALDDFDLEMAASLREHLRIPGMGETTTRYFPVLQTCSTSLIFPSCAPATRR
jgi:hypothetical protein